MKGSENWIWWKSYSVSSAEASTGDFPFCSRPLTEKKKGERTRLLHHFPTYSCDHLTLYGLFSSLLASFTWWKSWKTWNAYGTCVLTFLFSPVQENRFALLNVKNSGIRVSLISINEIKLLVYVKGPRLLSFGLKMD